MKSLELIVLIVVILFMGAFVAYGFINNYPTYILAFPTAIFLATLLFSIMRALQVRVKLQSEAEFNDSDESSSNDFSFISSYLILIMILPVIFLFGFNYGIPLYVFISCLIFRLSWLRTIFLIVFSYLFISVVFGRILGTRFPDGVFFNLFLS